MYYRYVLKELVCRHNRTLVNILGIAVGISLFVSINALSGAYKTAASQPFSNLGADLVVQRPEKSGAGSGRRGTSMRGVRLPFSNQLLSPEELAILNDIEGVASSASSLLLWEFTPHGFRTIMGVDLKHPDLGPVRFKDWIKEGRFPEKPGEVILEKHYAKFQHVKTEDIFEIAGRSFTVVGLLEIREGSQIAASNIYLPVEEAQALLDEGSDGVNMVYIRLKNPSLLNRVRSQIPNQINGVAVSSSDSFLELMGGVSMISDRFSLITSLIALMGAVLLIGKSMSSNLLERSREIGILKATGWNHGEVQKQIMGETLVQSVAGGLGGVAMGYLISYGLSFLSISIPIPWNLNPLPAMAKQAEATAHVVRLPVSVSPWLAAVSMVISLVVGCTIAFSLGRRTRKMKPADILRQL